VLYIEVCERSLGTKKEYAYGVFFVLVGEGAAHVRPEVSRHTGDFSSEPQNEVEQEERGPGRDDPQEQAEHAAQHVLGHPDRVPREPPQGDDCCNQNEQNDDRHVGAFHAVFLAFSIAFFISGVNLHCVAGRRGK